MQVTSMGAFFTATTSDLFWIGNRKIIHPNSTYVCRAERRYFMRKTDINQYAGSAKMPGDKISTGGSVARILVKGLLTVLAVLAFVGVTAIVVVGSFVYSLRDSSVNLDLQSLKLNYTSFIYVNGPNDDAAHPVQYLSLYSSENRIWVDYDKIPKAMTNAIVAIEDKRFWDHEGVDWIRTGGAVFNLLGGGSSYGGSTITQQLIKNLTGENEVSLTRKVKEIFRAMNLEKKYSKEEILTAYLNVVPFGNGCNGVEAAAKAYFGKSIKDCDVAQCAAIAGITQNPTAYNPFLHPEANKERQQIVLEEMHTQGKITDAEYQAAMKESEHMQFAAQKKAAVVDENDIWNWYTETLFEDVKEGLMKAYNCSADHAVDMIYHGGLKIYSAENSEMQADAEAAFNDRTTFSASYPNLQGSFFSMDYSGRVLAVVGARGKKLQNRLLNLATDTQRQPGSSIKPLAVYAPAVNLGKINYSSLINDEPVDDYWGKGKPGPNNWDSPERGYHGMITVEYALEQSFNAAAVQLFKAITPAYGLNFMRQKLSFTSITDADYNLAAAIGGLSEGVTVREMAAGFQIFGNGGKYYKPYTYYYVTDHDGNVIPGMDNRQEIATQAITSSSATIMNKLLAHTMVSGTGRTAAISGWQTFGKTGTTDSNKDSWFVGGTPYAVAGVWTGYAASPRSVEDTETAKRVWKTIMSKYLENKTSKTFQFDPNVVSATFCKKTGLLAVPGACSDTGVGWYDKDNMPAVSPVTASSGSRTPSGTVSGDSVVQAPSSSDASSEWLVSSDETDSEPDETSSQTESSSTASHEAPESSPASSATENDVTTGKSSKKSGNAATP